jgi:thioredoxin 1
MNHLKFALLIVPLVVAVSACREQGGTLTPHVVTTQNWENEVVKSDKPVFVDFWADWCGPCKAIAPAVEEVAFDYQDRVKTAKIDIDANPEIPERYKVEVYPTFIVFKDGKEVARQEGAGTKADLTAFLDDALKK